LYVSSKPASYTDTIDWDWYLDTPSGGGTWLKSPLFDPVSGFGGNGVPRNPAPAAGAATPPANNNPLAALFGGLGALFGGRTGGGCVADGPFKDDKLHIGPLGAMRPNNTRCLTRNLNAASAHGAASKDSFRATLTESKTFGDLRAALEMPVRAANGSSGGLRMSGSLHTVGHGGVGGEMQDPFTSTNDPLFFLHHAGLDRVWAMWQELEAPARMYDIKPASAGAAGAKNPFAFLGRGWGSNMTLDTPIVMGFAAPDRPVRVFMDTQNRDGKGILCYKYEKDAAEYLA
jgi:tyrosinase